MNLLGGRVLITGASGGIGRAVVKAIWAAGAHVALTGRRSEALHEVAAALLPREGQSVFVRPADLTARRSSLELVENAISSMGGLDILIHSAGVAEVGNADDPDPTSIDRQLQINLIAPINLTRSTLPHLLVNPKSAVVFIVSGAAWVPVPGLAAYSAAKAGLAAWGDALHREFGDRGLHVLNVIAGPTDTPLFRSSPLASAMPEVETPEALADAILKALHEESRLLLRASPEKANAMKAARDDPKLGDLRHRDTLAALKQARNVS